MDLTEFSLIDMLPESHQQPSQSRLQSQSIRRMDIETISNPSEMDEGEVVDYNNNNNMNECSSQSSSYIAAYEAFSHANDSSRSSNTTTYPNNNLPPKSRLQKRAELRSEPRRRFERCQQRKFNNTIRRVDTSDSCEYALSVGEDTLMDNNPITQQSRRLPILLTEPLHGAPLSRGLSNDSVGSIELMDKNKNNHHQQQQQRPLLSSVNHDGNSNASTEDDKDSHDDGDGKMSHDGDKPKRFGPLQVAMDQPFLSVFVVFIPLGMVSYFLEWSDTMTFCLNFFAIVPQAWLIGKATEDLAAHLGQVLGGILNAWFGNIVEMLLCISAIRAGELLVVKATLVGSILSNLLLVAGCSFLFGGFYHKVQEFSAIGASTNASLMTLSCLCLGLPTLYGTINPSSVESELNMSRSVSFFLIFMYFQYMVFQLYTHSFLFEEEDDDEEEVDLSIFWASFILGCCTVCCAANSEFLIHSIEGTVSQWNISKSFIGIILLPIIGNAAEHYTSVIVAMRNKMDLSLACAVGSSCQMALFVTPLTVLCGWAFGVPMSLDLHAFEMAVLLLAVLIVTSILQDGYSNWLEGSMLVSAYFVIALMYFFENPEDSNAIDRSGA